jgi:hypothetical protein
VQLDGGFSTALSSAFVGLPIGFGGVVCGVM